MGIVRADNAAERLRKSLKEQGFSNKQAAALLKTFSGTNDLLKQSSFDVRMNDLSSAVGKLNSEVGKLSVEVGKLSVEVKTLSSATTQTTDGNNLSSAMNVRTTRIQVLLVVIIAGRLLLSSPEALADSFIGKMLTALLSILAN
ncbi:hypothetical protein CHLRE_05g231002v5 [Chlamydomonas reinhardtii]|uniref:Uncharacterized protein n=1 Tax=Chlamydomonas reinhardtii TaxID=3055 RepID=A8JGB6_CHLRE|nr:uncharacterized protein CHLRE_05g231002v5 [Chlamydomonas reinhardtii]PNW83300.1 hypothetical protein CHLRE_05g231002v5 [Chlamydomonas reinhardtii]|eukprot:XP_001702263.1 predicted protein [Chlamydomonas reinhardtii]